MIHDDIRTLMEALNTLASQYLAEFETFPPSGAVIDSLGDLSLVNPYEGSDYHEPEQQVELLEAKFLDSAERGKARACAMMLDVTAQDPRTGENTEAILVSAEVEGGQAIDLFTPYARDPEGEAEVELGKPFAVPRSPRVFVD